MIAVADAAAAVAASTSSPAAAAADETDSHRRFTGIPEADDSGRNDDLAAAAAPRLPKMSGPKDERVSLSLVNDNEYEEEEEDDEEEEEGSMIMTSEMEQVANGFVRDGSSLPYVFETSEAGNRKRSSKILPVCGMCGKKFVCVTTMKRHLVTHTGEKPFNCKVCGKQYTQKGNLRVHERTHRNDRPFQCNICHQKFYRKEPMQKHQWRQHGIVHFKSRPTNGGAGGSLSGNSGTASGSPQVLGIIGAEGVLYSSLIDRLKEDGTCVDSELVASSPPVIFAASQAEDQPEEFRHQFSHPEAASHGPTADQEMAVAAAADSLLVVHTEAAAAAPAILQEAEMAQANSFFIHESLGEEGYVSLDLREETVDTTEQYTEEVEGLEEQAEGEEEEEASTATAMHHRPLKLKQQLAQAYMREVKENREREERGNREREGRDSWPSGGVGNNYQHQLLKGMNQSLSEFCLSSSGDSSNGGNSNSSYSSPANSRPESRVVLPQQHQTQLPLNTPVPIESQPTAEGGGEELPDMVEVQCKSCGQRCQVADPYSFCCGSCGVRYTSLPTHMIADPLQCIGCLEVFAHKLGLKAHQQSTAGTAGRERPFRCCRCGFEFRQKAHLQKHQWRIHRKKLEPEATTASTMRQAEILLQAAAAASPPAKASASFSAGSKIGTSEAEAGLKKDTYDVVIEPASQPNSSNSNPLDLSPNSPNKMYGTAGSITKWVKQVETARTPIVPDISIMMKEVPIASSSSSPALVASAGSMPRFKELLSRQPLTVSSSKLSVSQVVAASLAAADIHPEKTTAVASAASVTVHRVKPAAAWPPAPLLAPQKQLQQQQQHFAVKSRPPMVVLEVSSRGSLQRTDDNPLLNQVAAAPEMIPVASMSPAAKPPPAVILIAPRASKRARTEAADAPAMPPPASQSENQHHLRQSALFAGGQPLVDDFSQVAAADLSLGQRPRGGNYAVASSPHALQSPLSLNIAGGHPLQLETAYSTVSPPLNLSSSSSSSPFASGPQTTAFDYTLGGGKSRLLHGQLQRLKNQDQRSGI